jgi:hypothetical protein
MSRTREWPPSPFNAAPTFVWVSRSEVSWNSPSRDPNQQIFCWRVTRVRPLDAGQSGTKNAVALCQGGRPSFPPSPRAWPVMLGAADMPIGCALTFSEPAGPLALPVTQNAHVPKTHMAGTKPGHAARDRLWALRRRLALDWLPLALAGLAAEEQGLAHHR